MINNITTMDMRPQLTVAKATPSVSSMSMPAILGFKTPVLNQKANIRVKKIKRGDNIIIPGEIDEDYVDIVEEKISGGSWTPPPVERAPEQNFFESGGKNPFSAEENKEFITPPISSDTGRIFTPNTFTPTPASPPTMTRKIKYLKNCYIIDYIQSPKPKCGLGTEAIKQLAEKAMFDNRAEGRIVTFSAPLVRDASPAMFFYKLGFRFTDPKSNEYMEECLKKNMPDIPVQVGMMYLPKSRLHKLLHYGELF